MNFSDFMSLLGVFIVFILIVGGGLFGFFILIKKSDPYLRSKIKYKIFKKKFESNYIEVLNQCGNIENDDELYKELLLYGAKPSTAKDIVFINMELKKRKVKGGKEKK